MGAVVSEEFLFEWKEGKCVRHLGGEQDKFKLKPIQITMLYKGALYWH